MVKSLKRNFITVLLLACVIFSLTLPTLAYDINTPEEVEPTIYNRTKWIATEVMQPIKDVVESFTGVYSGIADGLYDAYLEVFKNGGTDHQGNVVSGALPMTDSNGYVWYPMVASTVSPSSSVNTSSEIRTVTKTGNRICFERTSNSTYNEVTLYPAFTVVDAGTYKLFLDFHQRVNFDTTNIQYTGSGTWKSITVYNGFWPTEMIMSGSNMRNDPIKFTGYGDGQPWRSSVLDVSLWAVKISGPTGSPFSGFGGGRTRGGGAGRRYDLIPASKADGVAVGSGVSRDDVLADYALFDEDTKTVSIPQADGSTVNYTANTWVYNYETRTYNITTTNSTTVYITYGDDKATVTDGDSAPVDYYYTVPVAPDGGGGDDGGDDDGDGGFWDTILGGLADAILGFFKAVGVVAAAIFEGLVNLLTDAVASIGQLVALVGSLGAVVGGFFAFLPAEVQAAVSAGLIVVVTFSVISVIRK